MSLNSRSHALWQALALLIIGTIYAAILCLELFERTTDAWRPPLVSHHRGRVERDVVLLYLSSGTLTGALKIND